MTEELYYVQDSRNYVGDSVLWWRINGQGHTTNLAEAMKVDKDWCGRDTDIMWKCSDIDACVIQKLRDLNKYKREEK